MADESLDSLREDIRAFLDTRQTMLLATVAADGLPNCSYAPYVELSGRFYIFVSGLAKHTANLLSTRRCHAMFITDESDSVNVFARKRLSYSCAVAEVPRDASRGSEILEHMADRFGPTLSMLRSLPDFRLLELTPREGSYVRGFGQAISFDATQFLSSQ